MTSASTPSANGASQGPHFSPHSTAKTAQISGRMVSSGISDVAIASIARNDGF